jgi:glycogen operon protein
LGATLVDGGVNFCVYAKHATGVELLLFDRAADARASRAIQFDPQHNRSGDYWHAQVDGIGAGQLYGYRVAGPNELASGLRFEPTKLLVDPYALAVANTERYERARAEQSVDNAAVAMKSVVVDPDSYDWEGDRPLERPVFDSVI